MSEACKAGDTEAVARMIAEGQDVLTAHGWLGVRAMPPKGGNPELSLEEFARATAYMVRTAGGNWTDPDGELMGRIRHEEAKRIEALKLR